MNTPAIPENEVARLAALRSLEILDTEPEERYDRLTRLAAAILDVPIALVSLVDEDRQWFKSKFGLDANETPRDISFCGHAILGDEIFEVPNAIEDERFADNPLVADQPNIRFYAGQPLHAPDGHHIGTLCVIDTEPKVMTDEQRQLLSDLARIVEQEMIISEVIDLQKTILKEQKERRIYQRRLEDSELRFRRLAEATTEGIVISEMGLILDVNKSLADILGYEQEDLIGKRMDTLISQEDRDTIVSTIRDADNQVHECTGLKKDGGAVPLEVVTNETMHLGKNARVTVLRDLSERKQIEQMKNDFVSTVSHELRTPLTSIQGSLGLILGGLAGDMPAQLKELLEIAHNNSSRLIQLINDILDIQKIESGQMDFIFSEHNLTELVSASIQENQAYADQYSVRFDLLASKEHITVSVDPTRLKQVMANLLSNATKYSPEDDTVTVQIIPLGHRVEVRVVDKGPGIPEDFRDRVFQKFSQADASLTRQKGGTGLGLSITKMIVEKMDGSIGFESEAGRGTEFYFTLPRITETIDVEEASTVNRVLICEDNQQIASIMKTILEKSGYSCDLASTAGDAHMLLQNNQYLAMTLDITLPDKDGLTFFRELRQDPVASDLPVIIISAYGEEGLPELEGAAVGIVNWLQKPVDYDDLLKTFQNIQLPKRGTEESRILHVEDDDDVFTILSKSLDERVDLDRAVTVEEAKEKLAAHQYDLVILDISLPDGRGDELLPLLNRQGRQPVPVVVFSAHDTPANLSDQVSRALQKSRTTITELCEIVTGLIEKHQPHHGD